MTRSAEEYGAPTLARVLWGLLLSATIALPLMIRWVSEEEAPHSSGTRPQRSSIRDREVVTFWHFWGGADRAIVERVVQDFNSSQTQYWVRAIAMPGNNLDMKLFLAMTGGDPPDLVNQDDPILGDWASRGALLSFDAFVPQQELRDIQDWLYPAALRLGMVDEAMYGLCNGLDVRALYVNRTLLTQRGLEPPRSLAELDAIAAAFGEDASETLPECLGFMPSPKHLWAWGIVFGGQFYDSAGNRLTLDDAGIVQALTWMESYGAQFGEIAAALRARDQSLPGKMFPLLAGRFAMMVDGQWRVRDIAAAQAAAITAGRPFPDFEVLPLPPPASGRSRAGWVNGNFFLVPKQAENPGGAWAFMKFWCGFPDGAARAAELCARGGWIPVSAHVTQAPPFQAYLEDQPLFASFVDLAGSSTQVPRPNIPGGPTLDRELRGLAERVMMEPGQHPLTAALHDLQSRFQPAASP